MGTPEPHMVTTIHNSVLSHLRGQTGDQRCAILEGKQDRKWQNILTNQSDDYCSLLGWILPSDRPRGRQSL